MKRTRRSWNSTLKPGKPLKRKGKSRFPRRRNDAYRKWIRRFPCSVAESWRPCICDGAIECAHVRSRGAGGDDTDNCLPLCRRHHHWQHRIGADSFAAFYEIDPPAIAADLGRRWREQQGETAA